MSTETELWQSPTGRMYWLPRRAMRSPNLQDIHAYQHNPEVVRMMIDRYRDGRLRGAVAFVRSVVRNGRGRWCVRSVDDHEGIGSLWEVVLWRDNPLHVVEVVDSAAMKNGRHKHHWLRVPHTVTTARGAVAWTFGLRADQYHPVKET